MKSFFFVKPKILSKDSLERFAKIWLLSFIAPLLIFFAKYDPEFSYKNYEGFNLDMLHEGSRLVNAAGLLEGRIPLKDMMVYGHLLYEYGLAISMKIFGENIYVSRVYAMILHNLGPVLAFFLAIHLFKTPAFAILATSIILLKTVDGYRVGFGLLALTFFAVFVRTRKNRYLFIAGIFVVLAALIDPQSGAYALISIVIAMFFFHHLLDEKNLINNYLKSLCLFSLGIGTIGIPILLFLHFKGALPYLGPSFFDNLKYYPYFGHPFPSLLSFLPETFSISSYFGLLSIDGVRFYIPILVYIIAIIYLLVRFISARWNKQDIIIFSILLFGILIFKSLIGNAKRPYFFFSLPPAIIIAFYLFEKLFFAIRNFLKEKINSRLNETAWKYSFVFTLILLFLGLSVFGSIKQKNFPQSKFMAYGKPLKVHDEKGNYYLNLDTFVPLGLERAGDILVEPEKASSIRSVTNYIIENAKSNEEIYVASHDVLFYFLTKKLPPSRFAYPDLIFTKENQSELIETLKLNKVKYIIMNDENNKMNGFLNIKNRYSLVFDYFDGNYETKIKFGEFRILKII
jgi:hypothetical protein